MSDDSPQHENGADQREASGASSVGLTAGQELGFEETLLPPPGTIELEPTPQRDYQYRFMQPGGHLGAGAQIAELFQENTSISPYASFNVPMDASVLDSTHAWFVNTGYQPRPADFDSEATQRLRVRLDLADGVPAVAPVFERLVAHPRVGRRLYSLDLLILSGSELFRLGPKGNELWLDRNLGPAELRAITDGVVGLPRALTTDALAVVFVVAVAWRHMALQGARGYRRCLVDAGAVLESLEAAAVAADIAATPALDFYDARLNRTLYLDGIERSVLAVVALNRREGSAG